VKPRDFLLILLGLIGIAQNTCEAQVPVLGGRVGSGGYSGYGAGYYGGYGLGYGYGYDDSVTADVPGISARIGVAPNRSYYGFGNGNYGHVPRHVHRSSIYDGYGYGKYEPNYDSGYSTYGYSQPGRPYYAP